MTATRGEMHHNQALQLDHTTTITAVQEDQPYKFLGTKEHALQDSRLMREETAKKFLQRSWLIWSSPQANKYKVQVTTTFVLPALTYHMPIIHWPNWESWIKCREKSSITQKQNTQRPQTSCCTSREQNEDVTLSQWNRCTKRPRSKLPCTCTVQLTLQWKLRPKLT